MNDFHGRHPTHAVSETVVRKLNRLHVCLFRPAWLAAVGRSQRESDIVACFRNRRKQSQGGAGASHGIVRGVRSRRRRSVKCFDSGMATKRVGISVHDAVRVCILGLGA